MDEIRKTDPANEVITQIRNLIADGTYRPGMRLPSERLMSESMNTTRGYIRKALQRLEMYGIVTIRPQSGVFIAEMGAVALDGLIANMLTMDPRTVGDFIETRTHLEILSARLAAERADGDHREAIKRSHEAFLGAFQRDSKTLETDHLFHLAVAGASANSVLQSLISLLTPDIIALNRDFVEEADGGYRNTAKEHGRIVEAILARNPDAAAHAMELHMRASKERRMGKTPEDNT